MRNRVKTLSRKVGALRKAGDIAGAEAVQAQSRALGETDRELESLVADIAAELHLILLDTPNLPSDEAPDGAGPEDNPVVRVVGYDSDGTAPTSGCRTGTSAPSSASSTSSAPPSSPDRCSRCYRGAGAKLGGR